MAGPPVGGCVGEDRSTFVLEARGSGRGFCGCKGDVRRLLGRQAHVRSCTNVARLLQGGGTRAARRAGGDRRRRVTCHAISPESCHALPPVWRWPRGGITARVPVRLRRTAWTDMATEAADVVPEAEG